MNLIKLLDISNPKIIKDTLNNVVDYTKQQTAETTELVNTAITEATEAKGIAIGAAQYAETAVDTAQTTLDTINTAVENTNGLLDGSVPAAKAVADELGNNLVNTYATKLSVSGLNLEMSYASDTGILGIALKDSDGNILSESSKDLPLELLISSGAYNPDTKEIVLTLANGDVLNIDVRGLIDTYLADEETLTLEGNVFKIKDEFKELISKTGGIETLVGTEEKPILFRDSMQTGKLYLVSGKARYSSGILFNISVPTLGICINPGSESSAAAFTFFNARINGQYWSTASMQQSLIYVNKDNNVIRTETDVPFKSLNGSITSHGAIYAPTTSGTAGQVLQSNGNTEAPTWIDMPSSGGIEELVGTEEKPINMATDMELNKLYYLSGNITLDSSTIGSSRYPLLVLKYSDSNAMVFNGYITRNWATFQPGSISSISISSSTGYVQASSTYFGIAKLNNTPYVSPQEFYAPKTSGTSGQILQSKGSGAPAWITPNYATLDDITNAIGNVSSLLGDTSDLEV